MRPPALEVGFEFIQTQPIVYKGVWTASTTETPDSVDPDPMKAWKIRLRLRAKTAVNIKISTNIDRLFYNELLFDLDEFLSFVFADIILVFKEDALTDNTAFLEGLTSYEDFNICYALGYNYNDISMSFEATFKYPNCYKTLIQSLTDWSQWTSIITDFGKKQYLYGLFDLCTMSDDNPMVTFWEYSPVPTDTGDVLFFGNDIFAPTSTPVVASD
jgi:hypothetical protein